MTNAPEVGQGSKVARGALFALSARIIQTIFQLITNIVLARLLKPGDYGLIAEVTAISGVIIIFQDFGLTTAGLQATKLEPRQSNVLFALSSGAGAVLTLLVIAGSPVISSFYHQPQLTHVAMALSANFLIAGVASQFSVQSLRALKFKQTASADFLATAVSTVLSLSAALGGLGYWSLVLGMVAGQASRLAVLVRVSPWRPGLPGRVGEVRDLIGIGGQFTFVQILNYLSQALDVALIGRYRGSAQAAYYNRAYYVMLFPLQQINGPLQDITLPVLSSLRDQRERYLKYLRTLVLLISYILIPAYAILGASAHPVVDFLYGRKWSGAGPLLALLALAGAARAYSNLLSWLSTSLQTMGHQVSFTVVSQPLVLVFLVLGIHEGGARGVTLAYAVTAAVFVPTGLYWITRGTFVDPRRLLGIMVAPCGLSVGLFLAGSAVVHAARGLPDLVEILLAAIVALPVFALGFLLSSRVRADIGDLMQLRHTLRAQPAAASAPMGVSEINWDLYGEEMR